MSCHSNNPHHSCCNCCHCNQEDNCQCSCHHQSCDSKHHSFADELLEIADEAWMELLKEKIKAQIAISGGAQLDQLAKIVADSNNSRWKHKLANDKEVNDYKEKIDAFFTPK